MMPRIKRYTLPIFKERGRLVHGDKFDYSKITDEHIQGRDSKIPIICNACSYEWTPTIHDHINGKYGCPDCAGNAKYTLKIFLRNSSKYTDLYDYSEVTEEHINAGTFSYIPIGCLICGHKWKTSIKLHLSGTAECEQCTGRNWSFPRFKRELPNFDHNLYDYSSVTADHFTDGIKSRIPIRCKICEYSWMPSIRLHFGFKCGCPNCIGNAPWTFERFKNDYHKLNHDDYDYSLVTEDHFIAGTQSHIPVRCKTCDYNWNPTINSHIVTDHGCPQCVGLAPWTFEKFTNEIIIPGSDMYDYSLITKDDIVNSMSHIPIKCKTCLNIWKPSLSQHVSKSSGCPHCCRHKGYSQGSLVWLNSIEQEQQITLQTALSPDGEYQIKSPKGGYYKADGYHQATNTIYEYHGDYWHGNPAIYKPDDTNKTTGFTFGELYSKTLEKEKNLRLLGYNLVVKWETPFDANTLQIL